MGIGPTDLPVTPIRESEAVRRVEREAEAGDLGGRQPPREEGRRKKPASPQPPCEVELSSGVDIEPEREDVPTEDRTAQSQHRLDITA